MIRNRSRKIKVTGVCLPSFHNPAPLYHVAPDGAVAADVLQPVVAPPGGLQSPTMVVEPVDLGKVEGDKTQPGHTVEAIHEKVRIGRRDV